MTLQKFPETGNVLLLCNGLDRNKFFVDTQIKLMLRIQHIGNAARHPGGKVPPGRPQDNDCTACHIFAAVVADPFHNGGRAGIAHAEAFARNTGNEGAAACCTVECNIADDDVLSRLKRAGSIRKNDQPAAGKPLSEIVVAVALERKRHALRQKRTE